MSSAKRQTFKKKFPSKEPFAGDWAEAVAAFENDLYRRDCAGATVAAYRSCLKRFAVFYCDGLSKPGPFVARLQETDLNKAFIDYLRYDCKLSASSINRDVSALQHISTSRFTATVSSGISPFRFDQARGFSCLDVFGRLAKVRPLSRASVLTFFAWQCRSRNCRG